MKLPFPYSLAMPSTRALPLRATVLGKRSDSSPLTTVPPSAALVHFDR